MIFVRDLRFKPLYISPSVRRQRGFTPEEVMTMGAGQVWTDDSLAHAMQLLQRELARDVEPGVDPGRVVTVQLEERCKDGSTIWTETTVAFLRDAGGRPEALLGVSRDITARKLTAEALAESEHRYRLLAENITDLIWTTDSEQRLSFISPSIKRMLGREPDSVLGRPLASLLTPASAKLAAGLLSSINTSGGATRGTIELELVTADGGTVWVEVMVSLLQGGIGEEDLLGVAREITARRQAEDEREALRNQLHQADKMTTIGQLAAGIAHEINNPTAFVQLNLALLQEHFAALPPLLDGLPRAGDAAGEPTDLDRRRVEVIRREVPRILVDCISGVERIRSTTHELRQFVRRTTPRPPGSSSPIWSSRPWPSPPARFVTARG